MSSTSKKPSHAVLRLFLGLLLSGCGEGNRSALGEGVCTEETPFTARLEPLQGLGLFEGVVKYTRVERPFLEFQVLIGDPFLGQVIVLELDDRFPWISAEVGDEAALRLEVESDSESFDLTLVGRTGVLQVWNSMVPDIGPASPSPSASKCPETCGDGILLSISVEVEDNLDVVIKPGESEAHSLFTYFNGNSRKSCDGSGGVRIVGAMAPHPE